MTVLNNTLNKGYFSLEEGREYEKTARNRVINTDFRAGREAPKGD